MEFELNKEQSDILKSMHRRCEKELKKSKKYKQNSVLFSILKMTNNTRHEFLRETADPFINPTDASYMIDIGLIRETDEKSKYAFTGMGLEYTEVEILRLKDYFEALDNEYFNVFENISIGDRERIILLTMLAARTFSSKAVIDMKESAGVQDAWWEIMMIINDLLVEHDIINKSNSLRVNLNKSNIEHPASHLIRHSDVLPRATKQIFCKTGKNEYYLSILDGNVLNMNKIADILELIFEKKHDYLTLSTFSSIMRSFCRIDGLDVEASFEEGYYDSKHDEIISYAFDLVKMRYSNRSTS